MAYRNVNLHDSGYSMIADTTSRRNSLDCAIGRYGVERVIWRLSQAAPLPFCTEYMNLQDDLAYVRSKQAPVNESTVGEAISLRAFGYHKYLSEKQRQDALERAIASHGVQAVSRRLEQVNHGTVYHDAMASDMAFVLSKMPVDVVEVEVEVEVITPVEALGGEQPVKTLPLANVRTNDQKVNKTDVLAMLTMSNAKLAQAISEDDHEAVQTLASVMKTILCLL